MIVCGSISTKRKLSEQKQLGGGLQTTGTVESDTVEMAVQGKGQKDTRKCQGAIRFFIGGDGGKVIKKHGHDQGEPIDKSRGGGPTAKAGNPR